MFQFLSEGWSPGIGLARMWELWPELRLELRPSFLHRGEVCGRRRSQVAPRHTRKRRGFGRGDASQCVRPLWWCAVRVCVSGIGSVAIDPDEEGLAVIQALAVDREGSAGNQLWSGFEALYRHC